MGHKHPHRCVSIVLTVLFGSRLLRGANPSCHRHRWIATKLSHYMRHAHVSRHKQPTTTCTPPAHHQPNESHQISQAC